MSSDIPSPENDPAPVSKEPAKISIQNVKAKTSIIIGEYNDYSRRESGDSYNPIQTSQGLKPDPSPSPLSSVFRNVSIGMRQLFLEFSVDPRLSTQAAVG